MNISYTSAQKFAIEFFQIDKKNKHLVIEAGAGSGKTAILKERVRFLLLDKKFLPEDLVVITFTKNSTEELKHRLDQLTSDPQLLEKIKFIHVSTIDSFFASLVENLYPIWWDDAHRAQKIPSQLSLLHESHALVALEEDLSHGMNGFDPAAMCEVADFVLSGGFEKSTLQKKSPLHALLGMMLSDTFLSTRAENIRISAQTVHPATQKLIEKCHEIARNSYENRIAAGTFTYQDRNVFLKENLHRTCPIFFKELIVDEYQDTNHIQHEILWQLVQMNHAQMTVVGDPKQSIYAFRGSNVDVFQSLLHHEEWNVISLDVNFRSIPNLLNEVNTLSSLSFDWKMQLPDPFKETFFHTQAVKKSIEHKSLKPGAHYQSNEYTTTLFEFAYELSGNADGETSKKRQFNENNLKSLGLYLIQKVHKGKFNWKDIAILCEKNKQIAKIKEIFTSLHIPCVTDAQSEKIHGSSFAEEVGLSLFHVLHDGIINRWHLFYVLISPLTELTYEEVIHYYNNNESSLPQNINDILSVIKTHQTNFYYQPFIAWQNCRSELTNLCVRATNQQNAFIFSRQMDNFAKTIFSLSQIESPGSMKRILEQMPIEKNNVFLEQNKDAVTIKTVHGAKGLEWDVVCFYPAMSKQEQPEIFSVSNSWPYLDINWLSEDIKSLSRLPKRQNEKFQERDHFYHAEKEKKIWFSDLRTQLEKNFERQRVFYTAFTRPRKHLIFVHPERQNANSALKIDKKFSFSHYEKNFEQDIYLKYSYLLDNGKALGEHVKFVLCQDEIDKFLQGQKGIDTMSNSDTQQVNASSPRYLSHNISLNLPHASQDNFSKDEVTVSVKQNQIFTHLLQTPTAIIQKKQKVRIAMHRGIMAHCKAENKIFSEHSIQAKIHQHAFHVWSEFEISNRVGIKCRIETKRIDLLALFKKSEFDKIYDDISLGCVHFKVHSKKNSDYVFLIIDFKATQTFDGIVQIVYYADLLEKIISSGFLSHIIQNQLPSIYTGLLLTKNEK